ncbi:MAG: 30S ribosomal protein S19 [Nanoarchaeota archaeon]
MAKKEFSYKGKTLEELKQLSLTQLAELLPARQRRSIKKGLDEGKQKLIKKIETKKAPKTHARDMIVLPSMVGKIVRIHNGREFIPVTLEEDMIGLYFGSLVLTRRRVMHNAPGIGATKSSSNLAVK